MQWKPITGESEALRLDLQFLELELIKLKQPSKVDIVAMPIMDKVTTLSMHLNEVRSKVPVRLSKYSSQTSGMMLTTMN